MELSTANYPEIMTAEEKEKAEAAPVLTVSAAPTSVPAEEAKGGEYLTITPERLASIAASRPVGVKKSKPQYPHTCSRCGKVWNLAIQLDPTRPMYCPECRPIVMEERKKRGAPVPRPREEPARGTVKIVRGRTDDENPLADIAAPSRKP